MNYELKYNFIVVLFNRFSCAGLDKIMSREKYQTSRKRDNLPWNLRSYEGVNQYKEVNKTQCKSVFLDFHEEEMISA
jgi:hypothetical protein